MRQTAGRSQCIQCGPDGQRLLHRRWDGNCVFFAPGRKKKKKRLMITIKRGVEASTLTMSTCSHPAGRSPRSLYANAAISVYVEAAWRRQVGPPVATVAFSLKCECSLPICWKASETEAKLCLFLWEYLSVCMCVSPSTSKKERNLGKRKKS